MKKSQEQTDGKRTSDHMKLIPKEKCEQKTKDLTTCYGGNCSNEQFNHCYSTEIKSIKAKYK